MKINKYKIIALALVNSFVFSNYIFANWIDVTANLPSGTYDKVLKIELTPTDTKAKTFYSFNPNGWPNDALLYTWAIILKKSTPLVFFSFINTQIESKIKINNYTINYSNNINLFWEATLTNWKIQNLFIKNNDQRDVDISYWELRKDWKIYTIPDKTILYPGETMDVSDKFNSAWTITLFSPNSESKDFINIIEKIEPKAEIKNTPIKKEIPHPTISREVEGTKNEEITIPIVTETTQKTSNSNSPLPSGEGSGVRVKNPEINVDNIANEITNPTEVEEIKPTENLWDNLKISVNWSKNDANWLFIMITIIIVTLAWVWIQIVIRRKSKV